MSFGGHALDAIIRIKYNRTLIKLHRARYQELKDAVSKIKSKHPHKFIDRNKLPDKDIAKLKKKIRTQIILGRRKSFIITLVISFLICTVLYLILISAYNYFYNN